MANEQEQLRDAIEQEIHGMLESGVVSFSASLIAAVPQSCWVAVLEHEQEVGFRPAGEFAVLVENQDGEEKVYRFRVRVESIPT